MNMRYGNIDGKIVVFDDEGNLTYRSDSDHCEEILISENLIETMTNKIEELESSIEENNNIIEVNSFKNTIKLLSVPVLLAAVAGIFFQSFGFFWLCNFVVTLPYAAMEAIANRIVRKRKTRENKGINSQLDYLKQFLALEKEHLVKLKEINNSEELESEKVLVSTKLVNDEEKLQQLELALEKYYEMGYDGKDNQVEAAIQYRK